MNPRHTDLNGGFYIVIGHGYRGDLYARLDGWTSDRGAATWYSFADAQRVASSSMSGTTRIERVR